MEKEQTKVANNTITRDLIELSQPTGNIYESVMIMAKQGADRDFASLRKVAQTDPRCD